MRKTLSGSAATLSAIRPELTYSLRFQTGYKIDLPLEQFQGSAHSLSVYSRIVPEGRDPVYLAISHELPDVPATDLYGEVAGKFVVGEGAYGVEVLVEDDARRVCYSRWRVQAKLSAGERELVTASPPGAVEQLGADTPRPARRKPDRAIGRLTILMDAAPLIPDRAKLAPADVDMLVESLSSLLEQLPARSVRLVLFNIDRQAELFRKEGFARDELGKVTAVLNELQLAVIDYATLRNRGNPAQWLADLIGAELEDTKKPDAVIVLGPQARLTADIPPREMGSLPPFYYLQFQPKQRIGFRGPVLPDASDSRPRSRTSPVGPPLFGPLQDSKIPDTIQRLAVRIKGETIVIRNPHDLADAIRRIDSRAAKTALPVETATGPSAAPGARAALPAPAGALPKAEAKAPDDSHFPDDVDPVGMLARLRQRIVQYNRQAPNYTCVETVLRRNYEPAAGRAAKSCDAILSKAGRPDFISGLMLISADRLRLDVALAPDREIYSWAGASRFEDRDIDEMVPEGAMGTGAFAAHLLNIFGAPHPKFFYEGETTVDGRQALEYSFVVPLAESAYYVKAQGQWILTGYTASFFMDPKTAELISLRVKTDELPASTALCEADTTLRYELARLGASDFLLPKVALQRFIGRDGAGGENTLTFSACREYQAQSKLEFGTRSPAEVNEGNAAGLYLPPGLPVTVELTAAVHSEQAAAGDRIEGRLTKPIRDDKQQKTLVPEGAAVHGRLMRVETRDAPALQVTLVFRWETVEIDGASVPLSLIPDRRTADLNEPTHGVLRRRGVVLELPAPGEGRYATLRFRGDQATLPVGDRSEWLTAKPE